MRDGRRACLLRGYLLICTLYTSQMMAPAISLSRDWFVFVVHSCSVLDVVISPVCLVGRNLGGPHLKLSLEGKVGATLGGSVPASLTMVHVLAPVILLSLGLLAESSIFSSKNQPEPKPDPLYKGFSGLRAYDRSIRVVYYHDQTVAVAELGPNRLLLNCELIEVYEPSELEETLDKVSKFAKPHRIKFDLMMDLMDRCSRIETPAVARKFTAPTASNDKPRGASSILSGVVPGTKWCGAGDLADTYFDLGEEENLDRCCRTHDLCPSKIRGHTARYDMMNDNMYTKSHCKCDSQFQRCLKKTNGSTADIIGHFYFDLLKVPCIDDRDGKKIVLTATSYST